MPTEWGDLISNPSVKFDLNQMTPEEAAAAFTSRLTDSQVGDIISSLGKVETSASQRQFVLNTVGLVLRLVRGVLMP